MPRAAALFLSHGAPDLILHPEDPAHQAIKALGRRLPRPEAVVVATAHWTTREPAVGRAARPATIHDFGGFAPELSEITYPAPGAPAVAERAVAVLAAAGITARAVDQGLDHGVWVPLGILFPDADIPVVPLAVQPGRDGDHHLALGRALAPMRDDNVLIIGSGSATHNLGALVPGLTTAPAWVQAFDDWFVAAATAGDTQALARWTSAPHARHNHPTPEHFLPALVAAGAGGPAEVLHRSTAWGALAMTVLSFR